MANLVFAMVAASALVARPSAGPPPELVGTWDVEHVGVDSEDSLHRVLRPDDPQLMGRVLVIGADRVQFERGKELGCKQARWGARRTTWGALFGKGFIRSEVGGLNPRPSPEDFGVKVSKNQPAVAYSLCPSSPRGAGRFPRNTWAALQAPDLLALHFDNQTVLTLRRRASGATPAASFACAKAATATEKTICGSFDLASWDRSVALAFRQALGRRRDKDADLKRSQREWLRKRDACGSDAACIDEAQWRRVEELGQE